MAANNLRIIYQNAIDTSSTTVTASSTASASTPTSNLKLDPKSQIWRSGSVTTGAGAGGLYTAKANLVVAFANTTTIGGIILPFCNLSPSATIRVRGYTGATPTMSGSTDTPVVTTAGILAFDTSIILACPYQPIGLWNWGTQPLGVNSYSYGGGTYARAWVPSQPNCTSLLIEIVDTANYSPYIETSRLIIGGYWSLKYNTTFGLSQTPKDLSTNTRSESGDLISNRGVVYTSVSFDLTYLTPSDRLETSRILKGNGLSKPLFVSLFPDNSSDPSKEQAHQVYGKLSQLSGIQHTMFDIYGTQIEIEEI